MAKKTAKPVPAATGAPYEANWIVDESQRPEALLERHGRTAASPAAHEAYRRAVEEKVEKTGLIHIDPATGYRSRFSVAEPDQDNATA